MSSTQADTLGKFIEILYYFQSNEQPNCWKKNAWKTRFGRGLDLSSKKDLSPAKLQISAKLQKI